jgi:hypothetical protein
MRFPAGSRKIIDRLPHGWVVGGNTLFRLLGIRQFMVPRLADVN